MSAPHRILFVCHGNICRSTMAEFVMKDLVSRRGTTTRSEAPCITAPAPCWKRRASIAPARPPVACAAPMLTNGTCS